MKDAVHVAITCKDNPLAIMTFLTKGRSPTLPFGAKPSDQDGGWTREPTDANILDEITRTFDMAKVEKYRVIDHADIPEDRSNRADWSDDGETIG